MTSSGRRGKASAVTAARRADILALYEHCSESEKALTRNRNALKEILVRQISFGAKVFDGISDQSSVPLESHLAAKYTFLGSAFRDKRSADERLRLFAQWLWTEFQVQPEDSLGERTAKRLSSEAKKRVNTIPWNDYFYAELVKVWLPYSTSILEDSQKLPGSKTGGTEQSLTAVGYDAVMSTTVASKSWRSAIELTCEWLASRGGIPMIKPRKDPDMARTLRNAYSRMHGSAMRRLFEFIF
jgi:hypothetical protein